MALERADEELARERSSKDEAYAERNRLVRFLASLYPAGIGRTDIPGWDPAWHGCVYVDTPAGQMSWHYHDREAALFADLPAYAGAWDGHTTDEKYRRLEALARTGRGLTAAGADRTVWEGPGRPFRPADVGDVLAGVVEGGAVEVVVFYRDADGNLGAAASHGTDDALRLADAGRRYIVEDCTTTERPAGLDEAEG